MLIEIVEISGVTEIEGRLAFAVLGLGDSLTDMLGIGGVTPMEGTVIPLRRAGVSLTDMLGIGGVTPIDGTLTWPPLLEAGVSLTEILGMGGVTFVDGDCTLGLRRKGLLRETEGVSETEIVGMGGAGDVFERNANDP